MTRLEAGQLWVMRIHALGAGLVALIPAFILGAFLGDELGTQRLLPPLIVGLLLLYPVLIGPGRRYAAWGYDEAADALEVAHGVWTQVGTVVPYGRVQHIDVSQGPIERAFGVARLVLHTAGTAHSEVVLPGLSRDRAEAMRDRIRGHIRLQGE